MDVQWERSSPIHSCPSTSSSSFLSFLGIFGVVLFLFLFIIMYLLSIYQWSKVLLPSLGVWQGCVVPSAQVSWRAYSHHTARFSGGQWSITWAISWPLDSLGAERNDLGALFPWREPPSPQLQCIHHFPLKSPAAARSTEWRWEQEHRNADKWWERGFPKTWI